jgi:hypothetical protein
VSATLWTRQAKTRLVLGVRLARTAPDTWSAGGWSFRLMEGQRLVGGAQEWCLCAPQGLELLLGSRRLPDGTAHEEWSSYEIAGSLRSAVRTMLLVGLGRRRVREVAR